MSSNAHSTIDSPCKVWGWAGAEAELFFIKDTFSSIYLWMVFSINIIVTAATGKLFFFALNLFWYENHISWTHFLGFPNCKIYPATGTYSTLQHYYIYFVSPLAAYLLSVNQTGLSNRVESAVVYSTCIFVYLIFSKYSSSLYKVSLPFAACILSIPDHVHLSSSSSRLSWCGWW